MADNPRHCEALPYCIPTASRTLEKTGVRSRAIERRLRSVEKLPEPEALEILALPLAGEEDDGEDAAVEGAATEPKNE